MMGDGASKANARSVASNWLVTAASSTPSVQNGQLMSKGCGNLMEQHQV
jgi:hypothetical protein